MSVYSLAQVQDKHSHRTGPVCIIGAGLAGLLVATRLARAGRHVIVVESGGDNFDAGVQQLNAIEASEGLYNQALTGRFREFGGNSRYWGGRLIPLSPHDTDPRPYLSLPGWPILYRELAKYQQDVEALFGLDNSSYEEDLLEQLDADGFLPRGDPELKCRWIKIPSFRRTNLAAILRQELALRDNVEVWLGATVCDFEIDRLAGRLSSIVARDFSGRRLTVNAREFVWAAGAIETTRLLLLLDAASEHRAFQGCQVLGRYFQEHAKATVGQIMPVNMRKTNKLFGYHFAGLSRRCLYLELTPVAQEADEVASAYAEVALDLPTNSALAIVRRVLRSVQTRRLTISMLDARQLANQVLYLARGAHWYVARRQMLMGPDTGLKLEITVEQLPEWSNRITLSPQRDRLGAAIARLDWRLTERDERTFQSATRRIAGYWMRSGLERICPIEWAAGVRERSIKLIDSVDQRAHPSGSTRMGIDPRQSVVGPDLRCHHIPNASVVSTSTFPSAGSINPTMTLMQLALRAADKLLQTPSLLS
jgi:choline dehydrogenase-like flavoprotein